MWKRYDDDDDDDGKESNIGIFRGIETIKTSFNADT